MIESHEINFDALPGVTHNYGGLSYGNVASLKHKGVISNPKAAALQGLKKMMLLSNMGFIQGILPPHERPHIPTLKAIGFTGTDQQIIEKAYSENPQLLMAVSSSAAMWAANAATISPSSDTTDHKVHFTPANLINKLHRAIEPNTTKKILHAIFDNPKYFTHHEPLPSTDTFSDEGAANHTRFCSEYDASGVHFFVFGKYKLQQSALPKLFPARQTYEASKALAMLHKLHSDSVIFAQQNPIAIDGGVFHNDVISVGNQNVFLYHELAYINTPQIIDLLKETVETHCKCPLLCIEIKNAQLSLEETVKSYLFNSQLLTNKDKSMTLVAPIECEEIPQAKNVLETIHSSANNPINTIIYFDLRQSMQNGGGPACLRLRVVLNSKELNHMNQGVLLTPKKYDIITNWINKYYRSELTTDSLRDPSLLRESRESLDELTRILNLGDIYDFQK